MKYEPGPLRTLVDPVMAEYGGILSYHELDNGAEGKVGIERHYANGTWVSLDYSDLSFSSGSLSTPY